MVVLSAESGPKEEPILIVPPAVVGSNLNVVPPTKLLLSIAKLPICPELAFIIPDIDTAEAVICPLAFNTNPLALISVVDKVNPPIVPPVAFIEPLISKPAAEADRNVTAPLFILIASEFIDTWLPPVGPIVVVVPKEAEVCPAKVISKLSASIFEKLLESNLVVTPLESIKTWLPAVGPICVVVPNEADNCPPW